MYRVVAAWFGYPRAGWRIGLGAVLLAASTATATAMPIDTGGALTTNWDNTVTATAARQLQDRDGTLGYGYPGGSGSAAAYDRGAFTPMRLDLLSELDLAYRAFGLRASAATRFEQAETAAPVDGSGADCYGLGGTNACRQVRSEIELREAFVHGATSLGDDQRLSFRLGRHTLIWGESVYFARNGIAGGQAPVDTATIEQIAGYQADTVFLPVGQASASWQPGQGLAVDLYYQFEWRPSRIGSLGPYLGAAGAPPPYPNAAARDPVYYSENGGDTPPSTDQYGIGVKWHWGDTDYGLYALSFDAKTPTLHVQPAGGAGIGPVIGSYSEDYPTGIQLYGASMAGSLGAASYGAEVSLRRDMPLVTGPMVDRPGAPRPGDYPAGDTLQANASLAYVTPPWPGVPDGARWTGEVAVNRLLQTTANPGLRNLDRTGDAAAMRTVLEPQFLRLLPRLDVTVPLSIGYNFYGLSAIDPQMNRGTGDVSIGLSAVFDGVWKGALNLTHYFGTAKNVFPYDFVPAGRPLSDADFVSLSVQRSF